MQIEGSGFVFLSCGHVGLFQLLLRLRRPRVFRLRSPPGLRTRFLPHLSAALCRSPPAIRLAWPSAADLPRSLSLLRCFPLRCDREGLRLERGPRESCRERL